MGVYEIIEKLCAVARLQADIIRQQAEVIAQAEIADELAAGLSDNRETAAAALATIEKEYN